MQVTDGSITIEITKVWSATAAVTMSAQDDHFDFNGALSNMEVLMVAGARYALRSDTDLAYNQQAMPLLVKAKLSLYQCFAKHCLTRFRH